MGRPKGKRITEPSPETKRKNAEAALAAADAEGLTLRPADAHANGTRYKGVACVGGKFAAKRLSSKLEGRSAKGTRRESYEKRVALGRFWTQEEAALACARDLAKRTPVAGNMTAEQAIAEAQRLGLDLRVTHKPSIKGKYTYILQFKEASSGLDRYYINCASSGYVRPGHMPPHFSTAEEAALEWARFDDGQMTAAQEKKTATTEKKKIRERWVEYIHAPLKMRPAP